MKNNKGFGKFEVLTIIVVLLIIVAILGYIFLGGASEKKIKTIRDSANSLVRTVVVHKDDFHNSSYIYLGEVIDDGILNNIKNPVGKGNCSPSESFVHIENNKNFVTLSCGDYMILEADNDNIKEAKIYKVGEWTDKKSNDNDLETTFYNCKENGKKVFDEDYEEFYFIYQINKKYGTRYYFMNSVGKSCTVEKKVKYRSLEEIKFKE